MSEPNSILELKVLAQQKLSVEAYAYAAGGADDELTLNANCEAFRRLQIRCRRLVDVSSVDTSVELFGRKLPHPIALAPVGFHRLFHEGAEIATAHGAASARALMIASSLGTVAFTEIAKETSPLWFQLYPTTNREVTKGLLGRAETSGAEVVVLTVDVPVPGNRQTHGSHLLTMIQTDADLPNYQDLRSNEAIFDPSMTWEMIPWLRANCGMKILLKGIVTREDAELCVEYGVDGVVVSNHGGRQEESNRGSIECLPEVVSAIDGRMPVLIDGGFRRGTDIFKALALGADVVCVGRPYVWGLAALGSAGVARAIEILRTELVRAMQLAGAPSLSSIDSSFVQWRTPDLENPPV